MTDTMTKTEKKQATPPENSASTESISPTITPSNALTAEIPTINKPGSGETIDC